MSFIYSRIDRSKWFQQPGVVRFRHRFRGQRESYKLNTEANMMLFELRRLRELQEANNATINNDLLGIQQGDQHYTADNTDWASNFEDTNNASWPSLEPFGEWMHSSWSGSTNITATVQDGKGRVTPDGAQRVRHQPESAHMLYEAESSVDVIIPNIESQATRVATYARANNEEGAPRSCYFASLGNDNETPANFDLRIYKRIYDKDILLFSAPSSFGLKTSFQMKFRILQQGEKAHLQLKTATPGYMDSFTGSNSTTALSSGSHKLDDNTTTWNRAPTSGVTAASWGIINNEAYLAVNTSGFNNNNLYIDIGDYNGYVEAKFTTVKSQCGLSFRGTSTSNAYAVYNVGNDLRLVETQLFQTLAGTGNNRAAVAGDVIRVEFVENLITIYKNGNIVISYDETQHTSQTAVRNNSTYTKVGFFNAYSAAGLTNSARYDNFSAGKIENDYVEAGQRHLSLPGSSGNFAYTETKLDHVYLPGLIGNYLSSPDSSGFDITQDLELVARIALDKYDGVSGSPQAIISKWNTTSADRSYWLGIDTDKKLRLSVSDNGSNDLYATSGSVLPWSDGQAGWVKVTLTVATGKVSFYIAEDQEEEPSSWVPLGLRLVDLSTPGALTLFTSTAPLAIGAINAASTSSTTVAYRAAGKVYRAIVRRGIGGTKVADFDAKSFTSTENTTLLASTGETWTLAKSGGTKTTIGADLHTTKSLEVSAKVSTDWASAATQTITARSNPSSGNASWALRAKSGGYLDLVTSTAGSNASEYAFTSSAAVPFVSNQIGWVKATHDTANGGNYFSSSATAGNWLSTADSSLDNLGGSFDVRVKLSTTWTSLASGAYMLASKWMDGGGKHSFTFSYNSLHKLQVLVSTDGTSYNAYNSSVALSIADNAVRWMRAVFTGDTGTATPTSQVLFYYSTDGVTWTQLGTAVTSTVTDVYDTTTPLAIGTSFTNSTTTANRLVGKVYKFQLFKDNGETLVADVDFDKVLPGSSAFYDQQGNNWTLTTSATPGIKITSDSVTKFYTSVDGATWRQLGNTLTSTGVSAPIYSGVARLTIGAQNDVGTVSQLTGHVYETQVYNSVGGDAIIDINFAEETELDLDTTQFADSTGRDWVIAQQASTAGIAEMATENVAIGDNAISVLDEDGMLADMAGAWGLLSELTGDASEEVNWDHYQLIAKSSVHEFLGLQEIAFRISNLHQRLSKLEDKK